MQPARRAIALMGPTCSGKSDLAVWLAGQLPVELISVDSALVYCGMDIGTAKPDLRTRAQVPHHLIDIRDPSESYSAGEFVRDASAAMAQIWARGRTPLLVGGTMLYFHALSEGIAQLPGADARVRAHIDEQAARHGWPAVHHELAAIDPAAAARIHVNDPQRIQRALEVYRLSGRTITELQQHRVSAFADVNVAEISIAPLERAELHTKIETRFHAMMRAGLLAEVGQLFGRGDLSVEHPAIRAVGYRQLWRHLTGEIRLNEASEQAIAATRQLAKRQLTWLRRRTGAQHFNSAQPNLEQAVLDALCQRGNAQVSSV